MYAGQGGGGTHSGAIRFLEGKRKEIDTKGTGQPTQRQARKLGDSAPKMLQRNKNGRFKYTLATFWGMIPQLCERNPPGQEQENAAPK